MDDQTGVFVVPVSLYNIHQQGLPLYNSLVTIKTSLESPVVTRAVPQLFFVSTNVRAGSMPNVGGRQTRYNGVMLAHCTMRRPKCSTSSPTTVEISRSLRSVLATMPIVREYVSYVELRTRLIVSSGSSGTARSGLLTSLLLVTQRALSLTTTLAPVMCSGLPITTHSCMST